MTGAFVNNIMVPIDTRLKTGDLVEIKTSNNSPGPSEDWLKIVRTAGARNKIRQFLAKKEEENKKIQIDEGRKLLRDEIRRRHDLDEKVYLEAKTYDSVVASFGANNFDDLLYLIGRKNITAAAVLEKVIPNKKSFFDNLNKIMQKNNDAIERQRKSSSSGVAVQGIRGMRIQLSKCCNPIPGDEIVGFVSQGQGIKVHRKDCPNVQSDEAKKRLIEVYWDWPSLQSKHYEVDLQIRGYGRPNLLTDVITVLGSMKINILKIHGDATDGKAKIDLKISVENAGQLDQAKANLLKVQGLYEIDRLIH